MQSSQYKVNHRLARPLNATMQKKLSSHYRNPLKQGKLEAMRNSVRGKVQRLNISVYIALLLILLFAPAQANELSYSSADFLAHEVGLPSNTAFSVKRDNSGFIWVGTPAGIGVLDAESVTDFRQLSAKNRNFPLLNPGNLFVDSKNRLWAGSWGQGAAMVAPSRTEYEHFDPTQNGSLGTKVQTFFESTDGTVWIGSADKGLYSYNEEENTLDSHNSGRTQLSHPRVWSIAEDSNGNLWIGTTAGINYYDRKSNIVSQYYIDDSIPVSLKQFRTIAVVKDRLWVGTRNAFGYFDPAQNELFTFNPPGYEEFIVNDILFDGEQGLWLASSYGLFHFDLQSLTFSESEYGPVNLFAKEDMRSLLHGEDNILWIGTRESGLLKLDFNQPPIQHTTIPGQTDPRGNVIWSMLADSHNTLWIGTGKGLQRMDLDSGRFQKLPPALENIDQRVYSLASNRAGDLFIGTLTQFYRYRTDGDNLEPWGDSLSRLDITEISTIFVDSRDHVWISISEKGLYELIPGGGMNHYRHDPNKPSLSNNQVTTIDEDRDGNIWAGSLGGGVSVKAPGEDFFSRFNYQSVRAGQLLDQSIQDLFICSNGYVWLATYTGLIRAERDSGAARLMTTEHGFPNTEFKAILEDRNGDLWFSTSAGVSSMNRTSGRVTNYGKSDGIRNNQYNNSSKFYDGNNRLYFGGDNGFNTLDLNRIYGDPRPAPVYIKSLWVNNTRVGDIDVGTQRLSLDLDHEEKNIRVKFGSLDFQSIGFHPLLYKLEGFDSVWQVTNQGQTVNYTNLDPGYYRLRFKDAAWKQDDDAEFAYLVINIEAPLWQRPSVKIGTLLAIILLLYGVYKWRFAQMEGTRRTLENRIAAKTQELDIKNRALQNAYDKIDKANFTDPLTGFNNRRYLAKFLYDDIHQVLQDHQQRKASGQTIGDTGDLLFFLVDIDNFKSVNDNYGHDTGDEMLKELAYSIAPLFQDSDYLIRWGGEEFLVITRFRHRGEAEAIAEQLRKAVADTRIEVDRGKTISRSASVGYACFPFSKVYPESVGWERVVKIADHALFTAKHSGSNAWVGIEYNDLQALGRPDVEEIVKRTRDCIESGKIDVHSGNVEEPHWKFDEE